MELRQSFSISINSVGKTRHSRGKKWGVGMSLDIDLTVLAKISPKWIRVLNVKHKIINLQAPLSSSVSQSLLKSMSFELVMPSNYLILCHHLLLPSVFPSIRVFSNDSVPCIRYPKYWSFSLSISSSNEYSGLISFRMD